MLDSRESFEGLGRGVGVDVLPTPIMACHQHEHISVAVAVRQRAKRELSTAMVSSRDRSKWGLLALQLISLLANDGATGFCPANTK